MIYSITEGQQAEEYKKRKAAEEAEKNKRNPRLDKTTGAKHGFNPNKPNEDASDKDLDRAVKVADKVSTELRNRYTKFAANIGDEKAYKSVKNMDGDMTKAAIDAYDRKLRHESYGIFESVEFINEGVVDTTILSLFGLMYGIPLIIVTIAAAVATGINARAKSNIKKALKTAGNDEEELKDFYSKMKKIKFIPIKDLIERVSNVSEKDKSAAKFGSVSCSIIEDADGNILAYAVYDNNTHKYAYYILDKSVKKTSRLKSFVQALFEVEFGIIGPGIEKFIDKNKLHTNALNNKRASNTSTIELPDDEKKVQLDNGDKLYKALSGIKLGSKFEVEPDGGFDNRRFVYITNISFNEDDFDGDEWEKVIHRDLRTISKALENVLSKYGFYIDKNTNGTDIVYRTDKNGYQSWSVYLEKNPDDSIGWEIELRTSMTM